MQSWASTDDIDSEPEKAGGADADAEGDAMKKPAAMMRRPSATSSTTKKRPAGAIKVTTDGTDDANSKRQNKNKEIPLVACRPRPMNKKIITKVIEAKAEHEVPSPRPCARA